MLSNNFCYSLVWESEKKTEWKLSILFAINDHFHIYIFVYIIQ